MNPMNFKLPICPQCNETSSVSELPHQRLWAGFTTEFTCASCKIIYYGNSDGTRGYIENENYEIVKTVEDKYFDDTNN
jgi:hypothetical protein